MHICLSEVMVHFVQEKVKNNLNNFLELSLFIFILFGLVGRLADNE